MKFILSLLYPIVIAALFGFGGSKIFGFWEVFATTYGVLLILIYISRAVQINYGDNIIKELTDDLDSFLKRSTCEVSCPCGHKDSTVVFVNEELEIKCDKCNAEYVVIPSIETRLITNIQAPERLYDELRSKMSEGFPTEIPFTDKQKGTSV